MIAVAPHKSNAIDADSAGLGGTDLHQILEQIEVATGARCTQEESRRFLLSTGSVTRTDAAATSPTAQEMECLRQATFMHRLETGAEKATACDLMRTLQRLGYA